MKLVSVNELLENAELYENRNFHLQGVLTCVKNDLLISHWPKAERTKGHYDQVWIYTGAVALGFNPEHLSRISEKRVVVHGVGKRSKAVWPDCPGAFWHVHFLAHEIVEHKLWCKHLASPPA